MTPRFNLGADSAGQTVDLYEATVDELVKLRAAIDQELQRRKDEAQAQLAKLDAVIGKAA